MKTVGYIPKANAKKPANDGKNGGNKPQGNAAETETAKDNKAKGDGKN